MKKPSRFLRLVGVAGLLATLLAGAFSTSMVYAGAPDPDPSDDGNIGDIWDGTEPLLVVNEGGVYFPWVGNNDESTGLGPADTSTSVMNINDEPAVVFAWVGTGGEVLGDTGAWDVVGPFFLAPWASKTFTPADLGIEEGGGAPVHFGGYNFLSGVEICETVLGGPLEPGNDVNGNGECTDVEVLLSGDDPGEPYVCEVDDANGDPAPTVGGDGLNADGDCTDAEGGDLVDTIFDTTVLGGYAKQAVAGETLPYTTAADSSVSGYNAVGGFELVEFDDWYFPIVQTNGGPGGPWNSILRIANFGQEVNGEIGHVGAAAVTVSFFPADDAQGSLDTGFQLQFLVNTGETIHIDASDYLAEGWVGSAHIYSDSAVFAMVDRVKVGYSAWITNTASNAPHTAASNIAGALGQYVLFAPDVRTDFFGWNTGINVANLVNEDNNVNIQYFNMFGNAPSTLTRRLAAQGMTYFYDPSQAPQDGSSQDPSADVNADIIGSALIWSDFPVAAAIDATKYPESTTELDPNVFQTMSYSATGNVYTQQAFPLVQKGNPTTGQGATSGINIMNPNATAAQATVWWVNPSGFGADNFGTSAVAIPGFANGFVYTMTQGNLPNGFFGSAVMSSTLPVAAVTTQVDYQVEWDGTAVWNAYNPCGYYRDNGVDFFDVDLAGEVGVDYNCYLGDPFNTQGGQISKIFHDEDSGDSITGVEVTLYNEAAYEQIVLGNEAFPGIPWVAVGTSDSDGEIEWTNVPVGTYWLEITGVPDNDDPDILNAGLCDDFLDSGSDLDGDGDVDEFDFFLEFGFYCAAYQYFGVGDIEGPFTLLEGEDLSIENELEPIYAEKIVSLGDDVGAGVPVCLVEAEDGDDVFDPVEDTEAVDCELTDDDGDAFFSDIEPGWYFVTVNYGFLDVDGADFPAVGGVTAVAFGPEFFDLGGIYENDLDVAPSTGSIQKVLTLPDALVADIANVEIEAIVEITGPGGDEVEGGFQEEFLDLIGPNDEESYSITVFDVPTGGPYTIDETITITWDIGGDGGATPDVVFVIDETFDSTEVEGQVICDDYLQTSSTCDAVDPDPDDPDALVPIVVYEDLVTRVFNDVAALGVGQLDVHVRDEVNDVPLDGAEVCLFAEEDGVNVLVECVLTDATGIASFLDVAAGNYTVNASFPTFEDQAAAIVYDPFEDAADGTIADTTQATADVEIGLDPGGAVLDVLVTAAGAPAPGVTVALSPAGPGDTPGAGPVGTAFCQNPPVALDTTDADGQAQFNVQGGDDFCVAAVAALEVAVNSPVSVPAGDPDEEPGDLDFPDTTLALAAAFAAIIDVDVTAAAADLQTGVHFVEIFVADVADVVGSPGVCAGALVTSGFTTPTGAGTGTFSAGVAAGLYCVAANSADGLGLDPTVVTGVSIVAGDPINDSDVAITTT